MAQVLAPGVAEVKLSGLIGIHPWVVIGHYASVTGSDAWTSQNLQNLVNSINNSWNTSFATLHATDVSLQEVTSTDIGQTAPALGGSNTTVRTGTNAGGVMAPQLAAQVNYSIGARYRGGHPRSMFPPLAASHAVAEEDQWTSIAASNLQAAASTMWQAAGTAGQGQFSIPRYTYTYVQDPVKHKFIAVRTAFISAYPVNGFEARTAIATVRRRNRIAG